MTKWMLETLIEDLDIPEAKKPLVWDIVFNLWEKLGMDGTDETGKRPATIEDVISGAVAALKIKAL